MGITGSNNDRGPSQQQGRSKSLFRHRLPALTASILLTLGLILSFGAGFSCNFVNVTTTTTSTTSTTPAADGQQQDGQQQGVVDDGDGEKLRFGNGGGRFLATGTTNTNSDTMGIFSCPSTSSSSSSDPMYTVSRTFLALSYTLALLLTLPLSWTLTLLVPPTDQTWKLSSLLSGVTCVLCIPAFLLVESDACKVNYQLASGDPSSGDGSTTSITSECSISSGSTLLILTAILYAAATILLSCTKPPTWYEVRENWTVGKKNRLTHTVCTKMARGLGKGLDALSDWVEDRKVGRDWRLRYVGTRSTDGLMMNPSSFADDGGDGHVDGFHDNGRRRSGGKEGNSKRNSRQLALVDDDEAREMDEDDAALSTLEEGEFTGLTIELVGTEGRQAQDQKGEQSDQLQPPVSPITPAKFGAVGAVGALGAVGLLGRRDDDSSNEEEKREVLDIYDHDDVSASMLEMSALHPPPPPTATGAHPPTTDDPNALDDWTVGDDGSASQTTASSLGMMVQLQTSRLGDSGNDGVPNVVYKERPPAYDLESPFAILDEEREGRVASHGLAQQQYWADEDHLEPPSDAEDRGLVINTSRDEGSGGGGGSSREGDGDGRGTPRAEQKQQQALSAIPSRSKLVEKSQNLRSTIRSLGRKLSTKLETATAAAAGGGGALSTPAIAGAGAAAYVAMSVDGSEVRSRASSSLSGMDVGGAGAGAGGKNSGVDRGNDNGDDDLELGGGFVDEMQEDGGEDEDGGADADDEQTDDGGGGSAGGSSFGSGEGRTASGGGGATSSPSSASRGGVGDADLDETAEAMAAAAAADMDLSALLEEVIAAGSSRGGKRGGVGVDEEEPPPPPPPPLPLPSSSEDDDGRSASSASSRHGTAGVAAVSVEAGEMPDDEYEAYTTDEGSVVSAASGTASVPSPSGMEAVTTPSAVTIPPKDGEDFADPDIEYYTSASENESSSDVEVSIVMDLDIGEDMPDDELRAYVSGSEDGSSVSSYASGGSSGGDSSSYAGDDSSLSGSDATASEDEEGDKGMDDIVAGVLRRQEEKKKRQSGKAQGSLKDRRRSRRRKKKKRKGRRSRYSSANSVSSRTSLLDETIEEETDMELREMEGSSDEDQSDGPRKTKEDNAASDSANPHEMIMTDLLVAGARISTDKDILNTIVETSFTKAGSDGDKPTEKTQEGGTVYESGYLTRSPATSDSESKPMAALRRIVTPSSSRKAKSSSYTSLADSNYHSAPETGDGKKKKKIGTPATVFSVSPESIRSPPPADTGYLSDSRQVLGNRPRLLGIGQASYSSSPEVHLETRIISDYEEEEEGPVKNRRPVEATKRRVRTHSLPPVLHQISRNHNNEDDYDDGSSLQGGALRSPPTPYPMPTSWKNERRFRSPLHCPDAVSYYSDSSSNTEGTSSVRSGRSMRSSASRNRNARAARKKRLSMQGGGSRARSRTCEPPMNRTLETRNQNARSDSPDEVTTLEPHVISPSEENKKREKTPTWPTSHADAISEIMESMSQL